MLKRKLGFTDIIPFKLAGLAHHDVGTARSIGRECLQQFAANSATAASEAPVHHRISMKCLHPAGLLHGLLVRFCDGADMYDGELAPLREEACAFKFIRMAEQSVERCHAVGKMCIRRAPRHSEAFWSLALREAAIERRIKKVPNFIEALGKVCQLSRDAHALVRLFWFGWACGSEALYRRW